jgi:hypothetical protein
MATLKIDAGLLYRPARRIVAPFLSVLCGERSFSAISAISAFDIVLD